MALPAGTKRRLFGVEEYFKMGEAGILGEDDRVELIDGEILEMAAVGGPHVACVNRLNELLVEFSGRRYVVSVQNPVVLGDDGAPEPDLTLLRRREDFYAEAPPRAEDALLLVEVAETSLEFDLGVKVLRYARAGVAEVWVVDLLGRKVELFAIPGAGGGYEISRIHRRGEEIKSETVQ